MPPATQLTVPRRGRAGEKHLCCVGRNHLGFLTRTDPACLGGCSGDAQMPSVILHVKTQRSQFTPTLHQAMGLFSAACGPAVKCQPGLTTYVVPKPEPGRSRSAVPRGRNPVRGAWCQAEQISSVTALR